MTIANNRQSVPTQSESLAVGNFFAVQARSSTNAMQEWREKMQSSLKQRKADLLFCTEFMLKVEKWRITSGNKEDCAEDYKTISELAEKLRRCISSGEKLLAEHPEPQEICVSAPIYT
jgi:hypothetical protein